MRFARGSETPLALVRRAVQPDLVEGALAGLGTGAHTEAMSGRWRIDLQSPEVLLETALASRLTNG